MKEAIFQINVVRFGVSKQCFSKPKCILICCFLPECVAKVAKPRHWAVLTFKRDQDYVLEVDVLAKSCT